MKTFLSATCALILALGSQAFSAEELTLGSAAPKLEVKKFLKGEEVKRFEKGKTYVVELWATWCGPCLKTIPHLTELQKKYEDVVFIGVAVLEEDQSGVAPFVEEMGDKMDYRVALDLVPEGSEPGEGKTVANWMEPAQLEGIPSAFIINGEGKIAWIGHPAEMAEPLASIVKGDWDLVAEAKKLADAKALEKRVKELNVRLSKLFGQFQDDGKPDELLATLDEAKKDLPEQASSLELIRFKILTLSKGRNDESLQLGKKLLETEEAKEPGFLDRIAWVIVDPEREFKASEKLLKFALSVAIKADELSNHENISVNDTLAKAYFDNGDFANAVKSQQHSIELAEGTQLARDPGLKKRLNQYKRALENSKSEKEEKK